jgi:preprotein translocase subunit YajC
MTILSFILQSGLGGIAPLLPFVLMFAAFYFLIIMPQRKRQRELQETVAALKAGDRVVTSGGSIATITAVRDTTLIVRSADKSILEISRSSVASLYADEEKNP